MPLLCLLPNSYFVFPLCNLLCGAGCTGRTRGACCTDRAGCAGRTCCSRRTGRAGRAGGASRPSRTRSPCRARRACNRYQTVVRRTARRPRRRAPIGNIEAAVIEEQISLRIQGRRVELACGAQAGTGGTRRPCGAGGCGDLWDLFIRLPTEVRGRIRDKFVVDMDLARLVALRLFAHGDKFDEL